VSSIELISSNEQSVMLDMSHPIVIYSRTVLNGMLLKSGGGSWLQGATLARDWMDTAAEKPRYCVDGEWRTADFWCCGRGAQPFAAGDAPAGTR